MKFSILFLGLLAGGVSAFPSPGSMTHVRRENRGLHANAGLTKKARIPRDIKVPIKIALTQRNLERGHHILTDISDPTSPRFGLHYKAHEIKDMFAPDKESVKSVRDWLHTSGIGHQRHSISHGKQFVSFDATAAEVERLLHTEYNVYSHPTNGDEHIGCDRYHLPEHVHHHIDFITPTIDRMARVKRATKGRGMSIGALPPKQQKVKNFPSHIMQQDNGLSRAVLDDCDQFVTPECIRSLYSIPLNEADTKPIKGNELGLFETGDTYDQADNDLFFQNFTSIPNGTKPQLSSIDGGEAPTIMEEGGPESLLDMQIAFPIVYPQGINLYQVDDEYWSYSSLGFGNTFLDALDGSYCTYMGGDDPVIDPIYPDPGGYNKTHMCGTYKPMNVISVSYGLAEFYYSREYLVRQCNEYMKLALAGITVVYASGDSGVGSRMGCLGNYTNPIFAPDYPASCPYVLSVGATMIETGKTPADPEVAANIPDALYSSGGGFSNYFARPDYQQEAVDCWYAEHRPNYTDSVYNISGRAYPDVAANGWNISTYTNGEALVNGGTSASAPIVASMLNRVNEKRLAAGKSTVGFVNPTFYQHREIFNDIVVGNNSGCSTDGFFAVEKWDPVTGLGTINFTKLMDLYMSLP